MQEMKGQARSRLFLLFSGLMLFVAACEPRADKPQGKIEHILNRSTRAGEMVLQWPHDSGRWDHALLNDMFVGLFARNAAGKPIPGMAQSYTVSDDGLVWTFHLRESSWSDGVPVTAADFVFALQRQFNRHAQEQTLVLLNPLLNATEIINETLPASELGVTALDENTLQIKLAHPVPDLPGLFSYPNTFPIPRHVVEEWGPEWTRPEHIVVNGPFKQVPVASGEYVKLVRNPSYFNHDKVCLDQVNYYPDTDPVRTEESVRMGKLDIAEAMRADRVPQLLQGMPAYLHITQILSTDYLAFNMRTPPFDDVRVRQALTMALDRNALVLDVLQARQSPAFLFVPPGARAYGTQATPAWAQQDVDTRRDKARELLQQAGYGPDNPLRFTFSYLNDCLHAKAGPAESSQWNDLAPWVQATAQPEQPGIHYALLRAGNFQVGDAVWKADYDDAFNYVQLMKSNSLLNYSGYDSPEYDQLLTRADRQKNADERARLLRRAEQKMLESAAIAPVWYNVSVALVSPRVQGWQDNVIDVHPSQYMCVQSLSRTPHTQ